MNAVGIFGGTFDPIHYGHLSAAWQVAQTLDIPVHLVLAGQPAHRDQPGASASERWHLLNLALSDYPQLVPDRRELDRTGPSYMVDTLASFAQQFPDSGRCLILGLDALAKLHTWHRWEELTDLAHLVVLDRPGYHLPATPPMEQFVAQRRTGSLQDLAYPGGGRLAFVAVPALEISASHIRAQLAAGQSPHFLMPPRCLNWAQRQDLYSPQSGS